jgi:hypothetical protein
MIILESYGTESIFILAKIVMQFLEIEYDRYIL